MSGGWREVFDWPFQNAARLPLFARMYRPKKKKKAPAPQPPAARPAPRRPLAPSSGFVVPARGWRALSTAGLGLSGLPSLAEGPPSGGRGGKKTAGDDEGGLISLEELDWDTVVAGGAGDDGQDGGEAEEGGADEALPPARAARLRPGADDDEPFGGDGWEEVTDEEMARLQAAGERKQKGKESGKKARAAAAEQPADDLLLQVPLLSRAEPRTPLP